MSRYQNVYVEGRNDRKVLEKLFPQLEGILTHVNGKPHVLRKIQQEEDSFGIVDRDLDHTDQELAENRPDESRLAILDRYCMESYFLESRYLFAYAQEIGLSHMEDWQSEETVERYLIRKGQELCFYSAANEMIVKMKREISFKVLTQQFNDLPILAEQEVRERLEERFRGLPTRDQMSDMLKDWEQRAKEIHSCCAAIEGVHRWIDGKVLLRKVIVQDIRRSDSERFARYDDDEFVDDLVEVVCTNPPVGLTSLLKSIGLLP